LPITSPSWTAVITDEINQLRVDADSDVARAEAERDRYAAVIEKAYLALTRPVPNGDNRTVALDALASVDSGSALAERDAEKWDEGHEKGYDSGRYALDDDEPETVETRSLAQNPYRAEQIRKEGQ